MSFDRVLSLMMKPWMVISYLVLGAMSYCYVDLPLAITLHQWDLGTHVFILKWITKLGLGGPFIVVFLLFALYFRYIRKNKRLETNTWFLWFCVVFPSAVCTVIKITLSRARPDLWFHEHLYGFYWFKLHAPYWSFPSGHTTTIMGIAFGLSVIFTRFTAIFLLIGVTVALSRILLTQHYLSDVLMAAFLALFEVGLLQYWFQRQGIFTKSGIVA